MPYTKGRATSFEDLVVQIVEWVTDETIHGDDAWELMRSDPWPRGTILKAKGLQGQDHSYIGLMVLNINKNTSYSSWYLTPSNIGKYFVWSPLGINMPGVFFQQSGGNVYVNTNPDDPNSVSISYSITDATIFAADFKALVFGVFKQYVDALDWDEQPGGLNIDVAGTGLKKGTAYCNGRPFKFTLPLYPGTGYPGIGMNPDEPFEQWFYFWLKKDKSNLTVVTKNRDAKNNEYWDMAQAGMLVPYHAKMQYPFPAVIAGSSSGARSVGRMDYTFGGSGQPLIDVQIDYGRHHWMLSRGMPTLPTMATDAKNSFSQILLCLPDGTWQYFANQVQTMSAFYPPDEKVPIFIVNRPGSGGSIRNYVMPTYTDLRGTRYVYLDQLTYQLETIKLVQNEDNRKNMLGYLPNIFWPSIPVILHGEVTLDGKKHLMLPNNWVERRWFYRNGWGGEYQSDNLQALEDEITAKTRQMNCLLRLED